MSNRYLEKIAELNPHQSRSVDKLMLSKGIILDHSTGSGKTRTILEAIKRIQELDDTKKQLIITPASLTSNIQKEINKHKLPINESRVETISYEKALNDIDRLKKNNYSLVALDEAHKLRNTTTRRFKELRDLIGEADHRLLATATPFYNSPSDISPLINLASGSNTLPVDKKEFQKRYLTINTKVINPGIFKKIFAGAKNTVVVTHPGEDDLKHILQLYTDNYDLKDDPKSKNFFPRKVEETVEVQMSPKQQQIYKFLEGDIPLLIRYKIRHNLPLDKKESAQLNAFSTGVRQASNSITPYIKNIGEMETTPKILEATKRLNDAMEINPELRAVIYSNYLKAGLEDYSNKLKEININHVMYHGRLTKQEKDKAVADYNRGINKVLLISSSGAEGLDLKGTRLMQILEPHFNNSKIDQVIGRGVRYKSHEHLPEDQREVLVQHFRSALKPGLFDKNKITAIDQYLKDNSLGKDEITNRIKNLLKQSNE